MHDGNWHTKSGGISLGELNSPQVRRDDDPVLSETLPGSLGQQGPGTQVLEGDVKEAFERSAVRVDDQDTIDPGTLNNVSDDASAYRLAPAGAAVLSRITEVRHNRSNSACARPTAGVGKEQDLHQMLRHRWASRLNEVDVVSADTLADRDVELAIGESVDRRPSEVNA
jgi:hypothetical protein